MLRENTLQKQQQDCSKTNSSACKEITYTIKTSLYKATEEERGKGKGKAITIQAWTGPKGSRRLRSPDFKTIGTRGWEGCQLHTPAAFTSYFC